MPGLDRPNSGEGEPPAKPLVGTLTTFPHAAANLPGAWPRFRGERFDGIAAAGRAACPALASRRARGALVDRAWRRARRRRGARRPRLRARLRSHGLGRRAAMPLAGRRPRLMAIQLSDQREAEPRHVAHRARRDRQVRRGHRAEVRRVVSRSRDGPRVLADRHGSAVRRDGAAVVRRPVPAGRSRSCNPRPRRQFAAWWRSTAARARSSGRAPTRAAGR